METRQHIVEIVRLESGPEGTFGVLRIDKQVFCATLEPRTNGNQQSASCIPSQPYICAPVESPKFGATFEIKNVPGRSHILFHAGNMVEHTEGCILVGQYIGKLRGKRAVLNSGATFRVLLLELGRKSFHLTITEHF